MHNDVTLLFWNKFLSRLTQFQNIYCTGEEVRGEVHRPGLRYPYDRSLVAMPPRLHCRLYGIDLVVEM